AKEFGDRGHDVTLFLRPRNRRELDEIRSGTSLNALENVKLAPIQLDYAPRTLLNVPLLLWKILDFTVKYSRTPLDVVLFNSPPVDIAIFAPLISRLKGTKQVIIFHGYGGIYQGKYPFGSSIIKFERRLFDRAVIHSESSEVIPLELGLEASKIAKIPNGFDVTMVDDAEPIDLSGSPRILFVGMLTQDKGINTLITAFVSTRKEFPEARLYIVGDGPERDRLEQSCVELGLGDSVSFEGYLPQRKLYSYYKSVDIFVLPSVREGFGIVLLEAMAADLPVIASDVVGAARELVKDPRYGRLFSAGDSRELADCLKSLIEERAKGETERSKGRELVSENFNWDSIAEEYVSLFQGVIP
ncbi:MAG: glycosyltransferase family 4 protein, partial [Thermoplasmata archaeon]|nr:glycosyltransferase family 4 protein [Thermoplasmata archaeon]